MKLKYNFVVREIGGKPVAVAVGKDNDKFNGMIKLNSTGEFIFEMLKNDTTLDEIAAAMAEKYGIDKAQAEHDAASLINTLKNAGIIAE